MPTCQEGMAMTWRHKVYLTLALSELDWSILRDAAPQEYFLTETISHSLMAIMAAQKWRKIWGTRNTGNHFGIYRYGDAWTLLGCKISSGILQKVHFLIWKPPQLPYSMVNISVNVAVIRDFNENLVAAKVEVIVGQCWLEAHFAGFWHALQLCKNGDFRRFNLRAT